ncbi:protein FAM114A2 [Melanotaenia boesemani]|uniref:protein FAM114A2 n=1 Tax=Melanotaenia boesemani TaxID=1250792 RepID=UPI001C052F0D|nr:protein FAM114A2 [Melanotaenia boesemani]XP_041865094.1 protein FAM114A2 [Melanotaenia boesemani]
MSDSEASCPVAEDSQEQPETQDAGVVAGHNSSPSVSNSSADVAPTRKTRRRAEVKLATEAVGESKVEEPMAEMFNDMTVSQSGWGYWGNWGVSILSTATSTVATVGQGLAQVIEKAETSLGIPSPTQLSAQVEEEQTQQDSLPEAQECREMNAASIDGSSAAGSALGMFSSLTSIVQTTGKTVITGGLDALEFIGKKTMDAIAEGDPGFKKTKELMNRSSTLSQVLREAKEREELQTAGEESSDSERNVVARYSMLFDEFHGLSHLEALEILSRESELKVKSVLTTLSGDELVQLIEELDSIKNYFSMMEFDDEEVEEKKDGNGDEFEREVMKTMDSVCSTSSETLRLSTFETADRLKQAFRSAYIRIKDMTQPQEDEDKEREIKKIHSVEDIHAAAILSLAEVTARSIELFHKLAEMILFSCSSTDVGFVSQLTVVLCKEMSLLSKRFTSCLTSEGSTEKADVLNPLITGVFLEASNSASYIQDAFQLLMPILEISHIQKKARSSEQ